MFKIKNKIACVYIYIYIYTYTVRHKKEAPGKIVKTHTIIDQNKSICANTSIVKINNFI